MDRDMRAWQRSVNGERLFPAPFVVGQHRSGTTLLRMMLDAHPDLAIPPKTTFIPRVAQNCQGAADLHWVFLETLVSQPNWADFHLDVLSLKERVSAIQPFHIGEALRSFYRLYAENHGKLRWGDKTPIYVLDMLCIQEILPEARFIHIIRDGRDVMLSVIDERSRRGLGAEWNSRSVRREAAQWVAKITEARRQSQSLAHYMEVRYEDLVLDTESTLRSICHFIDLPWNDAMLEYHKTAEERLAELVTANPRKGGDAEQRHVKHARAGRPPEASRVGRWRREMTVAARHEYEQIAGHMLTQLGYDRGQGHGTGVTGSIGE